MNWLARTASDESRMMHNIERLEKLKKTIHELAYFGPASQSGSFVVLQDILDNSRLVRGRPTVHMKLKDALLGENNQKVVMDAPTRFQHILLEAETLIDIEIGKDTRALKKLIG